MLQVAEWKVGLRAEVLGRDDLPSLLPSWEDLCRRSVEDNVYYSPRFALTLLDSIDKDMQVRFAVVWDQATLVALLPLTAPRSAIPLIRPAGQAWQSTFVFSCMPLLDRDRAVDAAGALLDVMESTRPGEWILPTLNIAGEACRAMIAALERRALPWLFLDRFERAALESGGTFGAHMSDCVRPKRRRDLARNRRRLENLGRVEHASHSFGKGLEHAVAAFLDIEAKGWKGRRGTALACNERTRAFALRAFTGGQAESICRADMLTLDGTPIAVNLTVFGGRTGFTVKCAYDEAYGSYCAGLLLEVEVIRSFLSEGWASRLDAATAGAHVVESLWPGRIEVADLMFSLSPRRPELRLRAVEATERMRRSARSAVRSLVSGLQGREKPTRRRSPPAAAPIGSRRGFLKRLPWLPQ